MITLRSYQEEAVSSVLAELAVQTDALLVMPTGSGKSEIFFEVARRLPGQKVLVLHNKIKLVEQTSERAKKYFGADHVGVFCGSLNKYEARDFTVASVFSLLALDSEDLPACDLVIVDEAHRLSPEDNSGYMRVISLLRELNPNLKIMGCTATPYRATGLIYGAGKIFRRVTYEKSLKDMIAMGYLVPPRLKKTQEQFDPTGLKILAGDFDQGELDKLVNDSGKIGAQIKDAMPRLEGRKKVIWACVNIKHAKAVREALPEASSIVHSELSQEQRAEELAAFERGEIRHLVFVTIVSEGYDFPPIDAAVFMRPTRSAVLYVQTCGRALRISPGKQDCLILDYGKVVENCGPLDKPRIPTGGRLKKKDKLPVSMKFCPMCFEYLAASAKSCHVCLHEFAKDPTKNLSKKADDSLDILSGGKTKSDWIEIKEIYIQQHQAKSGRACLSITYMPKDWRRMPVREYAVFDDTSPWMNRRANERLKKIAGYPLSEICTEDGARSVQGRHKRATPGMSVLVEFKNFPEVKEIRHEQARENPDCGAPDSASIGPY